MNLLFLDVETGGLNHALSGLCEVAAVAASFDQEWLPEIRARFSATIKPNDKLLYESRALQTQRRTLNDLSRDGRPEYDVLRELAEFVGREFPEQPRMVAFNSGFDFDFLLAAHKRQGLYVPFSFQHVCAMQAFRLARVLGCHDCEKANLEVVRTHYGVELEGQAHHALADCIATARVFGHILRDIAGAATVRRVLNEEVYRAERAEEPDLFGEAVA